MSTFTMMYVSSLHQLKYIPRVFVCFPENVTIGVFPHTPDVTVYFEKLPHMMFSYGVHSNMDQNFQINVEHQTRKLCVRCKTHGYGITKSSRVSNIDMYACVNRQSLKYGKLWCSVVITDEFCDLLELVKIILQHMFERIDIPCVSLLAQCRRLCSPHTMHVLRTHIRAKRFRARRLLSKGYWRWMEHFFNPNTVNGYCDKLKKKYNMIE